MFDLRYSINDNKNWLKRRKNNNLNCFHSYPMKKATKILIAKYTRARNIFKTTILERYLLNNWLYWAMFLLLKLVMPMSKAIFSKREKLNKEK